ncbi:YceI family protein [Candidatus Parcubacteria bacterium]|nr:YceI family protein [Candidatus Parcubacteria bacterium]
MKKTLLVILALVIVGFGAFAFLTRPVAAPTGNIQSAADAPAATSSAVYRISQASSKVEFQIHETLYGKPKLVIGTTSQISGDIAVSGSKIDIGTIKIDARTLKTDSSSRDGAIDRLILNAGKEGNEYIVFKPTSADLAGAGAPGKQVSFNVTGDLTISGVTKPATFMVTATIAGDKISGTASTTVKRSDYGLKIPSFSFIADVGDQFSVSADIVADKISAAQ